MAPQHVLNGRYELGALIGRGGMADVHRGTDTLLGRTVAVKMLRPDLARDPQFQARFKREAQAVAGLNHPAIVAVYDTGEYTVVDGPGEHVPVPYIVMEFVSGRTIRELIRAKELSIEDSIGYALGVLAALEYSHKAGIVHRDIKPANVMVNCDSREVKVMDFGIARALADSGATMTQTQAVVGTAQYLSPEQARGETVDARSDLYSAGCLLYEMLTGRPPFVGDSPVSLAYQHVREIPEPASSYNPEVSEALDSVLAKSLHKNRDDRFQDAASFRRALRAASNGIAVPAFDPADAPTDPTVLPVPDGSTAVVPRTAAPDTLMEIQPLEEEYDDGHPLPLLASPDGEVREQRRSRRRMWAATLVVFLLLAIAGAGFLVYNTGILNPPPPAKVSVPSVAGLSEADALRKLYDGKLVPTTNRIAHDKVPKGTAIDTLPLEGTSVELNSKVVLNISDGPSAVTIPKDLPGRTEASARDALRQLGITGSIPTTMANHVSAPNGTVIGSNPAPGAMVAVGSKVELIISTGKVLVPELKNLSREEAEALLKTNGLAMNVVEEENTQLAPGIVVRQSDPLDSAVEQGRTITVTVAKAPAPPPTSSSPTPTPTPTETKAKP